MVGKSDSYISHVENGRYKTPDYSTMCEVFKVLGIEEEKIEDYLYYFHILSPEREEFEEQLAIEAAQRASEPLSEEELEHMQDEADYYEEMERREYKKAVNNSFDHNADELFVDILDENIKSISNVLSNLSNHNINDGYELILGISKTLDEISTNPTLYNFVIKLFSEKLHSLDNDGLTKVLNTVYKELNRVDAERTKFGKPKQRPLIKSL